MSSQLLTIRREHTRSSFTPILLDSVPHIMEYYYYVCFGGLLALCGGLLVSQPTRKQALERQPETPKFPTHEEEHPEARWYKAYVLAVAADWLQVRTKQ